MMHKLGWIADPFPHVREEKQPGHWTIADAVWIQDVPESTAVLASRVEALGSSCALLREISSYFPSGPYRATVIDHVPAKSVCTCITGLQVFHIVGHTMWRPLNTDAIPNCALYAQTTVPHRDLLLDDSGRVRWQEHHRWLVCGTICTDKADS